MTVLACGHTTRTTLTPGQAVTCHSGGRCHHTWAVADDRRTVTA